MYVLKTVVFEWVWFCFFFLCVIGVQLCAYFCVCTENCIALVEAGNIFIDKQEVREAVSRRERLSHRDVRALKA